MARQITITRDQLGLAPLALHNPDGGYFVSDDWQPGGIEWQRYTAATSAWAHGEFIVGQRLAAVETVFSLYIYAATPADIPAAIAPIKDALSQYRYTATIDWDGDVRTINATGAADIHTKEGNVDPVFHRAGWVALEITIPHTATL